MPPLRVLGGKRWKDWPLGKEGAREATGGHHPASDNPVVPAFPSCDRACDCVGRLSLRPTAANNSTNQQRFKNGKKGHCHAAPATVRRKANMYICVCARVHVCTKKHMFYIPWPQGTYNVAKEKKKTLRSYMHLHFYKSV